MRITIEITDFLTITPRNIRNIKKGIKTINTKAGKYLTKGTLILNKTISKLSKQK